MKGKIMSAGMVSIVIPTLNEEQSIGKVIGGVRRALGHGRYEIIVVDGHSTDFTVREARRNGARVIYDGVGKGSALRKGLRNAKGTVIVAMDADLSTDPKELRLMIDSIRIGYDICMGSRFMAGGRSEDISVLRRIGNRFFVMLVNLLFGANYSDMCYGYRAFRRDAIGKLRLTEGGFGIETEISIKAAKAGLKVIEVPSVEKSRVVGEGKLRTFRDGYAILRTIINNIE